MLILKIYIRHYKYSDFATHGSFDFYISDRKKLRPSQAQAFGVSCDDNFKKIIKCASKEAEAADFVNDMQTMKAYEERFIKEGYLAENYLDKN